MLKIGLKLTASPRRLIYRIATILLLVLGVVIIIDLLPSFKANDFLEYWSTSRLVTAGQNPYDPVSLLEAQNQAGVQRIEPLMFYLPPWAFPFILPFSVFSYQVAQLTWLLVNICILMVCIQSIWRLYGGPNKQLWLAWLIGFLFAPTYIALGLTGQISPLVLAGITGFLVFTRKPKMRWLAGVFATLATCKPQVTYIFIIGLVLWSIRQKQWSILAGFFSALLVESLVPFIFSPMIFTDYIHLIVIGSPADWATPTIGALLRLLLGDSHTWLQYLPVLPGLIWLVLFWKRNPRIGWMEVTPLLLLVSVVTSVYAWTYDQVIFLVPILFCVRNLAISIDRRKWIYMVGIFVINLIAWILRLFTNDFWFFWLAPATLVWYLITQNYLRSQPIEKIIGQQLA